MAKELFQAGHKKVGGRKKGTSYKKTLEQIAEKNGVHFFEVLCQFANGDYEALGMIKGHISPKMRLDAVMQGCKYLYATKKAVEVSNGDDKGFRIIVEDYTGKK